MRSGSISSQEVARAGRRLTGAFHLSEDEVALRPKEFDVLATLARHAGRVVPRSQLFAEVWDEHWYGSTKTLDIHIWAVRRKIDPPDGPSRITTVRGVGYRLGSV